MALAQFFFILGAKKDVFSLILNRAHAALDTAMFLV